MIIAPLPEAFGSAGGVPAAAVGAGTDPGSGPGYAPPIWLVSAPTAVSFAGAVAGAVLVRALTDLSSPLAIVIGGIAGWILFSIVLGGAAERLDRSLHRMGGPRFRRRRR